MQDRSALAGRLFIAIAMFALGVQHLVYGNFVTRLIPALPASVPSQQLLAWLAGAGLIVVAIKGGRWMAGAGMVVLGSAFLLHLPASVADPYNGGLWTKFGKGLALSGTLFLAAARFRDVGTLLVSAFLILAGVQHFIYVEFVALLVPAWLPGRVFWAYFAGIALIAGGLGMVVPRSARLAAICTAAMIFTWVVILHIPRALADVSDSNETTAVFEALALTGAAILVCGLRVSRPIAGLGAYRA